MEENTAYHGDSVSSQPSDKPTDTGEKRLWRLKFPRSWKEVKALGWKAIVAFILFYLIRDSILYIVIPYLVYNGVID